MNPFILHWKYFLRKEKDNLQAKEQILSHAFVQFTL